MLSLQELSAGMTKVSDLSPLRNLKLVHLAIYNTDVKSLEFVNTSRLKQLNIGQTAITDLSVLKNSNKLVRLEARDCQINDFTPLESHPLRYLHISLKPDQSVTFLKSLTSLRQLKINDRFINKEKIEKILHYVALSSKELTYSDIRFIIDGKRQP